MNRVVIVISMLCLLASDVSAVTNKLLKHQHVVLNSYIVVFKPLPDLQVEPLARSLAARHHVVLSKKPNGNRDSIFRYAMQGFSGVMTEANALTLAADDRVASVEENAYLQLSTTRTFTDAQFNLDRLDQTGPLSTGDHAYSYLTTGSGVYIYIFDTGVERNHIEFDNDNDPYTTQTSPRVLDGANWASDGYAAYAPCNGYVAPGSYPAGTHGTAVASVAAGKTVGVASNAFVVPVRVVNCDGSAQLQWWCWGMEWVAGPDNPYPKRPAVLSSSVFIDSAAPWDNTTPISSFEQTVNNVISAGTTVVVSANNQANANCTTVPARMAYGNAANFPGTYRVITVGGTDEYDRLWRCANSGDCNNVDFSHPQGSDPGSNTGPCVDIYAPAHNLKVAYNSGYSDYRETLGQRSGTSFAAPLVAGVAARILQSNPNLTPQQVWDSIRYRAVPLLSDFDGDGINGNDILVHIGPFE
jgi:subtilisin family serine protease